MGTYNRSNNLPEEVSSLQKNIDELKQVQIIGNDNLVVYKSDSIISGQTLTAGVTAIFKITFMFDTPSTSYVLPRYTTFNLSFYNAVFYADPATVNDNTKKSWFYSVTSTSSIANFILLCRIFCSDLGTASIVRTV